VEARRVEARRSTQGQASTPELQSVVEQVIASGVSATEVKAFLNEHQDVFGDDAARRAGEAKLFQAAPKASDSAVASGVVSVKPHALRCAGLPWFQRVSLPEPPIELQGRGDDVVVDGERFSPSELLALLRAA
jgi:hypothetical protein